MGVTQRSVRGGAQPPREARGKPAAPWSDRRPDPAVLARAMGTTSLLAAAVFLLVTASARGAVTNLLENGDLERPMPTVAEGGLPHGWKASDFSTAGVSLVDGARVEGKGTKCLKIEGRGCGLFSDLIRINPGESLRFSGWVNSHDPVMPRNPYYVGLAWYDANRESLSAGPSGKGNFLYVPMAKGTGWRPFEIVVPPKFTRGKQVIPEGAAFVEVRIFLLEYPSAVLFDDLSLTQD